MLGSIILIKYRIFRQFYKSKVVSHQALYVSTSKGWAFKPLITHLSKTISK